MAFTYDGTVDTDLEKVRLQIGDTTSTAALFTDEEINVYLAQHANNVLLTAADLCDVLAVRFARDYDFTTDGQSFKRSQQSEAYKALAQRLRAQSTAGALGTTSFTRVDGYSEDVSAREGAGQASRTGRRAAGYFDPDLPH